MSDKIQNEAFFTRLVPDNSRSLDSNRKGGQGKVFRDGPTGQVTIDGNLHLFTLSRMTDGSYTATFSTEGQTGFVIEFGGDKKTIQRRIDRGLGDYTHERANPNNLNALLTRLKEVFPESSDRSGRKVMVNNDEAVGEILHSIALGGEWKERKSPEIVVASHPEPKLNAPEEIKPVAPAPKPIPFESKKGISISDDTFLNMAAAVAEKKLITFKINNETLIFDGTSGDAAENLQNAYRQIKGNKSQASNDVANMMQFVRDKELLPEMLKTIPAIKGKIEKLTSANDFEGTDMGLKTALAQYNGPDMKQLFDSNQRGIPQGKPPGSNETQLG